MESSEATDPSGFLFNLNKGHLQRIYNLFNAEIDLRQNVAGHFFKITTDIEISTVEMLLVLRETFICFNLSDRIAFLRDIIHAMFHNLLDVLDPFISDTAGSLSVGERDRALLIVDQLCKFAVEFLLPFYATLWKTMASVEKGEEKAGETAQLTVADMEAKFGLERLKACRDSTSIVFTGFFNPSTFFGYFFSSTAQDDLYHTISPEDAIFLPLYAQLPILAVSNSLAETHQLLLPMMHILLETFEGVFYRFYTSCFGYEAVSVSQSPPTVPEDIATTGSNDDDGEDDDDDDDEVADESSSSAAPPYVPPVTTSQSGLLIFLL